LQRVRVDGSIHRVIGSLLRRSLPCSALLLLAVAAPASALPVRFSAETKITVGTLPQAVATGEFDGNADPDLVVVNDGTSDNVSVLRGSTGTSFLGLRNFATGATPRDVAVGNFDGDAQPDLAVTRLNTNNVAILRGQPTAMFTAPANFPVGGGPRAIVTGMLDSDTDPDLAVTAGSNTVSVLHGASGATFGAAANFTVGDQPTALATGDFNRDGRTDLVVANVVSDDVSVLIGQAGGSFASQLRFPVGDGPRGVAVADFNGDGDPDLAVANENTDDVSILLGLPGSGFAAAVSTPAGDQPRAVVATDFTRDGRTDLAVADTMGDAVSVLVGNGAGGFAPPVPFATSNGPFALAAVDMDGDGEQDLVVADVGANDISRLRNTTPPDTSIASGPTGLVASRSPAFGFSADEPGVSFQCRIDAAAFAACPAAFTPPPIADGAHTLEVQAVDPAGNVDPSPAVRAFAVDATPPDTTIASGPSGPTPDSTPTFALAANEAASFQCRVDGAAFAACPAAFTTAPLPDGAHSFEARAVDSAGNVDPTPANRAFTSDATKPSTRIRSGPKGKSTDRTPRFTFTSSDAGSTFACRIDRKRFSACASPFTVSKLKAGKHTFEVRATDPAGNRDASPAKRKFTTLLEIPAKFGHNWVFDSRGTAMVSLTVTEIPRGAKVQVRCSGAGCPFARRGFKPDKKHRVRVQPAFAGRRLQPGALVQVRISAKNSIGKVFLFPVVRGSAPTAKTRCLPPGTKKLKRC
jgi:FG-GAP-like repeat